MELLSRTCNYERMNVERLIARGFCALGGVIWISASFGADYSYRGTSVTQAAGTALLPLTLTILALGLGWFYERLTAVLLFGGAGAVAVWGVLSAWELGVWMIMLAVLIAPMVIAGVLFTLAARMQKTCEQEEMAGAGE